MAEKVLLPWEVHRRGRAPGLQRLHDEKSAVIACDCADLTIPMRSPRCTSSGCEAIGRWGVQ